MSCPKVVRIVTPGPPGPGLTLTGPALAGRISGTGTLVPIPLGPNLGIVDGALTLTGAGSGTVTSVGLSVPTGFSVDNSPITGSGTLAISFTSGYSLPTTAKQGQWDQAYADLGQARTPTVHGHAIADVSGLQTALGAKADLVSGLVPASQLPSFVDDVLEFANLAAFPVTGEAGKLYIALNTNKQYRWAGSTYQEINPSPGSTDAIPEGSVNLYHTTLRAAAAAPVQSVAGKTGTITLAKGDVGLGNVDNTSDADKPVSTATAAALAGKVDTTDTRLSDARTPTAHNQAWSTITGTPTTLSDYGITDAFNPATPGAIGGTTPGAGTFTALLATTRLGLPSGAPASPAARDLYQVADTLHYRDSGGVERLLLNAADNLANLSSIATARTNLGAIGTVTTGITGAGQITNIISISQANYDAIPTKNAQTLYVISG